VIRREESPPVAPKDIHANGGARAIGKTGVRRPRKNNEGNLIHIADIYPIAFSTIENMGKAWRYVNRMEGCA